MARRHKEFLGFHEIVYKEESLRLQLFESKYYSTPGRIRIDVELVNGRPFGTLSIHVPRQKLRANEFVVQDGGWTRQMLSFWMFQDTGKEDMYGRPIWRLWGDDAGEEEETGEEEKEEALR